MKKMTSIIADMHIADAVATNKAEGGMDEKLLSREYYKQIYKNYGITQDEYLKSFHFYENNPKLFNKMYDDVLGEISRQEDSISRSVK